MLRALVVGQQFEIGRGAAQFVHPHHPHPCHLGEVGNKHIRIEAEFFLKKIHNPALGGLRVATRLGDDFRGKGVQCRFPARSNIGMYISTTIAPITSPMAAIKSGSNSRNVQSTQRAISSS